MTTDLSTDLSYEQWVAVGVEAGWVSEPACAMHDLPPMTPAELEAFNDDEDHCLFVLRIWDSAAVR